MSFCLSLFCLPVRLQWQHEDVLGPNNQPLSVSIPPRSVILSNMKKKLYKLSQDEGAIIAIQVSSIPHKQFYVETKGVFLLYIMVGHCLVSLSRQKCLTNALSVLSQFSHPN